jgi:hypothetical protein
MARRASCQILALVCACALATLAGCSEGSGGGSPDAPADLPADAPTDLPGDAPATDDDGEAPPPDEVSDAPADAPADAVPADCPDDAHVAVGPCTYDGCPAGKCCDLVTGGCADCVPECGACAYDFHCAAGLRCHKGPAAATGECVPECPDGQCGPNASCQSNPDGIAVCVPAAECGKPGGASCAPCDDDPDCAPPHECTALGGGRHCLAPCAAAAECLPGHVCYPITSTGKKCVPLSATCRRCAWEGCPDGQCCDLVTGECKACKDLCDVCVYDFQCAAGTRCHKKPASQIGVCVHECPDGACPGPGACQENANKVKVCASEADGCETACFDPSKPYLSGDGKCVECLNSLHCASKPDGKKFCDHNACLAPGCTGGQKACLDGKCHQCCEDADCPKSPDGTPWVCEAYQCAGGTDDPCLDAGLDCASDPYLPRCCTGTGTPRCCQCVVDADCESFGPACTCLDAACLDTASGAPCGDPACAATCTEDADCPPLPDGTPLKCATAGFCHDPAGACDGTIACCPAGEGCYDLPFLLGLYSGGIPGNSPMSPACSCTATGTCVSGKPCTDMAMLCALPYVGDMVCTGGSLPPAVPAKMCFDVADLLGGIGI